MLHLRVTQKALQLLSFSFFISVLDGLLKGVWTFSSIYALGFVANIGLISMACVSKPCALEINSYGGFK